MEHLAVALIALHVAADSSSPLGNGWLLPIVFGVPTILVGVATYRAQRGRDQAAARIEDERREKELEAAREAANAADTSAQNERLRIIAEANRQTIEQQSESLAAAHIENTRMHALELEWHGREIELRDRLRTVEDDRDTARRECTDTRDELSDCRIELARVTTRLAGYEAGEQH